MSKDGPLSEKLKDRLSQKNQEIQDLIENELESFESDLKKNLKRHGNTTKDAIQQTTDNLREDLSSWSDLIRSMILKYSIAVLFGALLLGLVIWIWIPTMIQTPTVPPGVTIQRAENGTRYMGVNTDRLPVVQQEGTMTYYRIDQPTNQEE